MYPSPNKTPIKTIGGKRKYRSRVGKYVSKKSKTGVVKMNKRFQLGRLTPNLVYSRKAVRRIGGRTRNGYKRTISTTSGGFFRKVGGRSINTKVLDGFARVGVTATCETNFTSDWTTQMGVVTMVSLAEAQRRILFCKAILKKFALKHDLEYEDETKTAYNSGNMNLIYKINLEGDSLVTTIFNNVVDPPNPAWDFLAIRLNTALETIYLAGGAQEVHILGLEVLRSGAGTNQFLGNFMELDLRLGRIHFYEKCTMKIQNRSLSQDGDDQADAVDNCPIYGKILQGNGNTPVYQSAYKGTAITTVVPFSVSQVTGTSVIFPNTITANSMQEPPSYKRIKYATGESKLHLDPGQIKTMECLFSKSYSLSRACKFMYQIFDTPGPGIMSSINPIGKFTQFYIEKMINVDTINPVRIAVEVNSAFGAKVSTKRSTYTQPYFKVLS